ncbi:MAG: von Willebrand factor type A domain-containing protein [Myxococcota bacterium]
MKPQPTKRRPDLTTLAISAGVSALAGLAVVSCFGDNIRTLFGMSADALAGDTLIERRTTTSKGALEKKMLSNFAGEGESYGGAPSPSSFTHVEPNRATDTRVDALSTFAIDVDTASYTFARRVIEQNALPPADSVRVEEWVNAFHYSLAAPKDAPFAVHVEGAPSPFDRARALVKVALQGREVANRDRKPAHLVFLVDTSGSMHGPDRLPLAKKSLRTLVHSLNARDTVALVTYAGDTRVVLEPTPATEKPIIYGAIESLTAGGGTAMGSGMELAYRLAVRDVRPGHVSRVVVLTDGDANIGANLTAEQMLASVRAYVQEGVTLTTVGFGMGNYRASALEQLADSGNGQAVYIDGEREAQRVFGAEVAGTLEYIAKDVKVQVAFEPAVVKSYRLVGYENRAVADEDFRNDAVDGGELGSGHAVTALYEVELTGAGGDLGTVAVRGLLPDTSRPFEVGAALERRKMAETLSDASADFRFATAAALAADVLRGNAVAEYPLSRIAQLAEDAADGRAERLEFAALMRRAHALKSQGVVARARVDDSAY